ncbi:MAG TPA: ion transporter [Candidatus Paceibacterota bacterium]|nr:ion transporter [Candidatus Paceibacterota bacterium]
MARFTSSLSGKSYEIYLLLLVLTYAVLLSLEPVEGTRGYTVIAVLYVGVLSLLIIDVAYRVVFNRPERWRSEEGGWLMFDIVAMGAAFIPGLEALRVLRLLRALSLIRGTRLALNRLLKSIGAAWYEILVATALLCVNGFLANEAFSDVLPERFGSLGFAILASTGVALGDDFWSVYSVLFSQQPVIA